MTRGADDDGESRLSRWSRLKRQKPQAEPEHAQPETAPPDLAPPETEEEEAALLARLDLPKPETLGPDDDFTRFMAPAVPAFLRQRALRVLWRSNPAFSVLDGLVEYGEDYRAKMTGQTVTTAYQVGRGFLRDVLDDTPDPAVVSESPDTAAPENTAAPAKPAVAAPSDPAPDISAAETAGDVTDPAPAATADHRPATAEPAAPQPPRAARRMVFTQDD